jgi:hypothetical protein
MASPLEPFSTQITVKILSFIIPGMIVSGLITLFKKEIGNWMVGKLRFLFHGKPPKKSKGAEEWLPDEDPSCPKCRRAMVKRRSKSGSKFWGCSEFPSCRGTIAIEAKH